MIKIKTYNTSSISLHFCTKPNKPNKPNLIKFYTDLLCVTDDLLLAMDSKKVSVVVLLDMSKAFDSISHTVLLQKLQALGVSSPSLD